MQRSHQKKNSKAQRQSWERRRRRTLVNVTVFVSFFVFLSVCFVFDSCFLSKVNPVGLPPLHINAEKWNKGYDTGTSTLSFKHKKKKTSQNTERRWILGLLCICDLKSRSRSSRLPNMKSKCSNDSYLPYLQDFFTVIFLTHSTIMNIWVTSCNFTTEWLHKFYLSHNPVILSEHQGHPNWNWTIEFCHV